VPLCGQALPPTLDQPRLRLRSGGIFSPSLFHGGRDGFGGAFGALVSTYYPVEGVGVATCAMIGMAAMVGGGTGAGDDGAVTNDLRR